MGLLGDGGVGVEVVYEFDRSGCGGWEDILTAVTGISGRRVQRLRPGTGREEAGRKEA